MGLGEAAGLVVVLAAAALGIFHSGQPTLCEAPGCSCPGTSALHCLCPHGQEVTLRATGFDHLPPLISSIKIENCEKVTVTTRCLEKMTALRAVRLTNISNLELEEYAFSWGSSQVQENYPNPGINVTIERVFAPRLPSYTFRGSIESIHLGRVVAGEVAPFAFSTLVGTERVTLSECQFRAVQPQAFKKFSTDYFAIVGGHWGTLPSHSIIDLEVRREFRLQDVRFDRIRSIAVRGHGPDIFRMQGCIVTSLEGDAFRMSTRGPAFVEDNYLADVGVGAFVGLGADPKFAAEAGKQELVFENNTLLAFADYALTFNTTHMKPTVDRIVLERDCGCADIAGWTTKLVGYTSRPGPVPGAGKLMWCRKGRMSVVAEDYYGKNCGSKKSTLYLLLVVGGCIAGVAVISCLACWCTCRRRAKRYVNVPTNSNRHSSYSSGSNRIMVVPDGKTYRETELHVIVERAEPITEFKPPQPVITDLNSSKD